MRESIVTCENLFDKEDDRHFWSTRLPYACTRTRFPITSLISHSITGSSSRQQSRHAARPVKRCTPARPRHSAAIIVRAAAANGGNDTGSGSGSGRGGPTGIDVKGHRPTSLAGWELMKQVREQCAVTFLTIGQPRCELCLNLPPLDPQTKKGAARRRRQNRHAAGGLFCPARQQQRRRPRGGGNGDH